MQSLKPARVPRPRAQRLGPGCRAPATACPARPRAPNSRTPVSPSPATYRAPHACPRACLRAQRLPTCALRLLPRVQCRACSPRARPARPACALRAPRAPCAPRVRPARPACALRAQPRAQLPSLCCIVAQAYPGSQYSLYCNTNLLPTKLYCNTISSQASHLYCNTLSYLTIQF